MGVDAEEWVVREGRSRGGEGGEGGRGGGEKQQKRREWIAIEEDERSCALQATNNQV